MSNQRYRILLQNAAVIKNVTFITNCDSIGFNVQIDTVNNVKEKAAKNSTQKQEKRKSINLECNQTAPWKKRATKNDINVDEPRVPKNDLKEIMRMFNNHYINIIEKGSEETLS